MTYQEFIEEWKSPSVFIKQKTSGSTGVPKLIDLEKDFMIESALRTNSFFNIDRDSLLYSCISPDYIGGKMMAVRALVANARLDWENPSNNPLVNYNSDEKISLLSVVPSQLNFLIEDKSIGSKVENILCGGAPVNRNLREKIIKKGLPVFESYGMTETSSHIALKKIEEGNDYFECLENIKVSLDSRGCLVISMPHGKIIKTNDLAEVSTPKKFRITGRADYIINTGGIKVNPLLIEEKIRDLIDSEFLIVPMPDEKWGEALVLKIEGEQRGDKEKLLEEIKKRVDFFEVPKKIEFVKQLKRTPNGKLLR